MRFGEAEESGGAGGFDYYCKQYHGDVDFCVQKVVHWEVLVHHSVAVVGELWGFRAGCAIQPGGGNISTPLARPGSGRNADEKRRQGNCTYRLRKSDLSLFFLLGGL